VQGCRDADLVAAVLAFHVAPNQRRVLAPLRHATLAHRFGDGVDIGGRFDAGGDQPLGGGQPGVRPFHGGATLQLLVEDRKCRLIGGFKPIVAGGCFLLLAGPENAAMLVADLGRCKPPGRGIAQIVGLRTPRVLHALFEQADLPVGVQGVPIQTLFGGVGARGGGAARGPLREMLRDMLGHGRKPGHLRPVIGHDIDPVLAQIGREIGLIERAPFLHAPVELVEPQAAHAAGLGQHRVEKGGVGMELHVAGDAASSTLEGVQLGVFLAAPVGLDDGDGRPGGVVVERDPADRARLPPVLSGLALSGAADLRLDIPHDAADSVMVRLVDHPALGVGRSEGPGNRNRLRRGECQVDVTDPRPGRVHPLMILLHGQLAAGSGAAGQDVLTLLRGQRLLPGAENGLETPYGPQRGP